MKLPNIRKSVLSGCFEVNLSFVSDDPQPYRVSTTPHLAFTDDPVAKKSYFRRQVPRLPHGGIASYRVVRKQFATPDEALVQFERMAREYREAVIVPVGDKLFEKVERNYLLGCERHVVLPVGLIPDQLRTLYGLRFDRFP